jgi:HSP20 family protein
MATDERNVERHKDVPARRDDWGNFWNDPLSGWRRGESPFRRFARDMDRWFHDAGVSRGRGAWTPDIETFRRGDEFVIRADLPGLTKEDVHVHVTSDTLTIEGERRDEREERREGMYRSERTYGSFCRVVPLPDGAITENANATFQNGVLEIVMPVPPKEVSSGRRLEIRG